MIRLHAIPTDWFQCALALCLLALATVGCDTSQVDNTTTPRTDSPVDNTSSSRTESIPGSELATDQDSAKYWNDRIVTSPNDPSRYVDRAAWHLRQGRIESGLEDLQNALQADPTYAPAWSAKADALYFTGAFDKSIEHLDACLDVEPSHIPCLLRRAEMHIHLRQYPEAFERLNDVLKKDDFNHEAYWMKGKIYSELGNLKNAKSSFQTAVEVEPDFFDGYIKLGLMYAQEADTMAIGYFQTAIELKPRSIEAKYNLAYFLQEFRPMNPRYLDQAMDLYDDISSIDPNNATAAFNRGYINLEFWQDYDSAIAHFSRAIEVLPRYHQAYFNRGLCFESLDDLESAESDYRKSLEIKPDYTEAARALESILDQMNKQ